ncbi:MAG: UvrB/UvrC motif-containing protein [Kiritimatiellae bacterium]|nr:UvrB/UvrC motif-containing protein [Kiritimatiellia bacterium]
MTNDISSILRGWDYDPDHVTARWITGGDGLPKIQLRLDLGLFQMETEGRPDGTTPHGYVSLLDYYLAIEKTSPPHAKNLQLDEDACACLQQEAVQYYYRYLAFYALKHLDGVIADTEHNLRLFDFVAAHAADDDLAWQFIQFYPYVRMMNARAHAEKAAEQKDYDSAISEVQEAVDDIRAFWRKHGDLEEDEPPAELDVLNELMDRLLSRRPRSKADRLKEALDRAIASENYEKAAALRDALQTIGQKRTARKTTSDA